MKIVNASINWNLGYNQGAELELLVDKIPDTKDLRYQFKEGMFFGEKEGFVQFFAHSGKDRNEGGYCGQIFDIIMEDGTAKELKGPWSGRSGVVNQLGFTPCVEVAITDEPEEFERGFFCAGAITLEMAEEAVKRIVNAQLIRVEKWEGEIYYEVRNSEGDCEVCKGFKRFVDFSGEEESCRWCNGTGFEKDHENKSKVKVKHGN